MKSTTLNKKIIYLLIITAITAMGGSILYAAPWSGPFVSPPNGNPPAPINVTGHKQTKIGNLTIDDNLTITNRNNLCFGSSNCRSNWPDLEPTVCTGEGKILQRQSYNWICADIGNTCTTCNTYECGVHYNGCGEIIDCGGCSGNKTCYKSGCCAVTKTCDSEGYECGIHDDGCGGKFNCGSCEHNRGCSNDGMCLPDQDDDGMPDAEDCEPDYPKDWEQASGYGCDECPGGAGYVWSNDAYYCYDLNGPDAGSREYEAECSTYEEKWWEYEPSWYSNNWNMCH